MRSWRDFHQGSSSIPMFARLRPRRTKKTSAAAPSAATVTDTCQAATQRPSFCQCDVTLDQCAGQCVTALGGPSTSFPLETPICLGTSLRKRRLRFGHLQQGRERRNLGSSSASRSSGFRRNSSRNSNHTSSGIVGYTFFACVALFAVPVGAVVLAARQHRSPVGLESQEVNLASLPAYSV